MNAVITRHYMNLAMGKGAVSFSESLIAGMGMLLAWKMDFTQESFQGILSSWYFSLAAVIHVFRPWMENPGKTASDLQHARTLLNLYSQNPCSYLTLEDDKILYFWKTGGWGHSLWDRWIQWWSMVTRFVKMRIFQSFWMNLRNSA